MPLYEVRCLHDHSRIVYYHRAEQKYTKTHICPECSSTQCFVLSMGQGLTYFSEKRPQIITNMGHEPVTITSPAQHQAEMRKRGLALAGQKRGMPGAWT